MSKLFRPVAMALLAALLCAAPLGAKSQQSPAPAPQDPLEQLKKLLTEKPELAKQLRELLDQIDKKPKDDEPAIPDIVIPGENKKVDGQAASKPSAPAPAVSRSTNLPDISVIGNNVGRFFSTKGDVDRNRLQIGEFEIGLQQAIYPGIRFDAFISGGADSRFAMTAEEAYATVSKIGSTPFGGLIGKKRLNFGKLNPIHPHARNFVDQPAALGHFLGPDALSGNGASVNYLLPVKGIFANLELGYFKTELADQTANFGTDINPLNYPIGFGSSGNAPLQRLWISKQGAQKSETELGISHISSKGPNFDRVDLTGVDFTYRLFPSTFSRIMLQGEAIWHRRTDAIGGTGEHTRSGHYLLANYRADQFFDYGVRYDNSKLPWPYTGHEQSLSFIVTDRLTEVTTLRLQYKFGDRTNGILLPSQRGFNELWLQFIWGGGPHTHPLN